MAASCHLEPVQFFLDAVKRIVADLVVGAHGEHRLPCRHHGSVMDAAVCRARVVARVTKGLLVCQMGGEFLPDCLGNGRVVSFESGQPRTQRAFTCSAHFAAHGIIIMQVERAQERLERQALDHQRADHDAEGGQHNHISIRERARRCPACPTTK